MTLTQAIQAEALRLGFTLVGVTTPEPPPHFQEYERWLEAGRHAKMAYLEHLHARQSRADPRLLLKDCRSILVVGLPYPQPIQKISTSPLEIKGLKAESPFTGRIASYAWGDDYHLVFPARFTALVEFIENQTGKSVLYHHYTDSGPVLERDLAQRAGLGWIGKNTNLIHPKYGSYFLLGELLLNIELDISVPFDADHCGTCQRCVDACPTGCILPDRTLDASRCLSYLTIELREAIPISLRKDIGNWVFGCDICQQVCPWNQKNRSTPYDPAFEPRPGLAQSDLIDALSLSQEDFSQRFRRSPIKRAKRAGYLRNTAVALGNLLAENPDHCRRPEAINKLSDVLQHDPHPLVRRHAAWALGRAGEKKALQSATENETDSSVLEEIQYALNT